MKRRTAILIATITLVSSLAFARKHEADPRIATVHKVFVTGNNAPAEGVRDRLMKSNACFSLVGKEADADAVLSITGDGNSTMGGPLGTIGGGRNWIASGTLTLTNGDLVWSKSSSMSDMPFQANSGGKVAGDMLIRMLAAEINCKM